MDIKNKLSETSINSNPFLQFEKWYKEHISSVSHYLDAVSLATASKEGLVSLRTVLLKEYSESGFVFYTNYNSKKGKQISQNPNAAMLFYWSESGRQIRIEGTVEKMPTQSAEEYFATRPRETQIGAWASEQSSSIPNRMYLEKRVDFFEKEFSGKHVMMPPFWGGFRLVPDSIEFWQEGEFRLHDRIQYTRKRNSWYIERLAP
jgi:pyridoxamine 5'-phosphate oxidase